MHPVARLRHVLARRPWLYWLAVLALAGAAGLVVADAAAGVDEARRSWGTTRQVVVTTTGIAPGEPLSGRVAVRSVPEPIIPPDALEDVAPTAVARQHLAAGEMVMAHDVAATGGPQSLIPDGWRAVAVAELVPTGAAPGDAVSVASGGILVTDDGLVVGELAEGVLVAVPADVAAPVAHAAVTGEMTLLLEP
jgi:hypothetical protein